MLWRLLPSQLCIKANSHCLCWCVRQVSALEWCSDDVSLYADQEVSIVTVASTKTMGFFHWILENIRSVANTCLLFI